jgi:hypothetical protein
MIDYLKKNNLKIHSSPSFWPSPINSLKVFNNPLGSKIYILMSGSVIKIIPTVRIYLKWVIIEWL